MRPELSSTSFTLYGVNGGKVGPLFPFVPATTASVSAPPL